MDQDRAEFIADRLKQNLSNQTRVYKFSEESGEAVPLPEPRPFDETKPEESFNMDDPMAREFVERVRKSSREDAVRKLMSPPDSLGLPPLLEAARWKYGMVDACFQYAMTFDGVLLFQIPLRETILSNGGHIVMPAVTEQQEQLTSTRAIVVDAGLDALDKLRSNGIDIGHKVLFTRMALYRPMAEMIDGKEERIVLVHAGDVRGSETLREELKAGTKKIVCERNADGFPIHKLKDSSGQVWSPMAADGNPGDYQL